MNYAGKFDATFASDGADTHSHAYVHVDSSQTHAPADAIIVPDAQLLFHADYSRSGSDLILSRDHHEYVVHDYFRGEKRAALASQDGAHLTADIVKALVGEVEVSQAGTAPIASEVIGHVTKLQGSATVIRNGVSVILNMGDNVQKGDVVESGANSTVGITFIDGTVFGLSANARMVLNEMVYDPNGSNNSSLLSLVAGTITFVAGETAKHGDMKIDTPVATMGIRGTAVLVEIDFTVPGQNAQPNASFQVLVEPDGTTGSYILFDKTTLQPIAVVNQAGQQVNINNGIINITTNPLTPDLQKLITDVFQQKFTDNTNPNTKSTAPSTDSIIPTSNPLVIKTAEALIKTQTVNVTGSGTTAPPTQQTDSTHHIPGAPIVHISNLLGVETTSFLASGERAGLIGSPLPDGAAGIVSFNDINVGDQPSVSAAFSSFIYKNAHGQNVTAGLSPLQLADIAATEVKLTIIPGANNTNIGSALFTYSIADHAFDFLAAGEQITLTYTITVNDNFAPAPDIANIPITITITGTNDTPVITTGPQTIAFSGGTSVPGGPLQILPTSGPPSGTLAFTDVDLTDTHTVTVNLETPVLTDSHGNVVAGFNVAPAPLAAFEQALKASIATDSTGTGNGVIDWSFVAPKSFNADIIPAGDTLTLTYDVTVADGFGGTKTQTVTVTILGTDNPAVVWIATTTPGGITGGLWSDTANWETGTVPTATDDTIVVTNQLLGLTPAFPTTINAAAVAHSLTMNDFNIGIGTKPTVINQSGLAVGDGGISLDADAAIDNEGSMSVAGAFKFHDQDPAANAPAAVTLTNSGTLVLSGGGDFTGLANVTNTGIFELSAGTLDVAVNIANALNATVAGALVSNDNTSGAKPITAGTLLVGHAGNGSDHLGTAIADGSVLTIDGKTITFSTAQTNLTIDASGNVTVGIGTGSTLTVGDVLTAIDGITGTSVASFVNAGEILLFTGTAQNLVIAGTGNVLAALGLAAGTTDYAGAIDVTGTLVLEAGGSISNASIENTVMVESTGVLMLEGTSFISGGTVTNEGTLNLQGTGELESGTLFNSSHVYVSGLGNLFDGEAITNIGTNADIQIDGEVQQPATLKLKGGTSITQGKVTIGSFGVLEVSGTQGATLDDVIVNDGNSILVDAASLLLLESTSITGTGTVTVSGELDNASGSNSIEGAVTNTGTIDVKAGTTLDLAGGLSGVGAVEIDAGATLKLAGAPAETFTFTGGSGTSTLELDSTTLPFNGTITANATAGGTFVVTGQGSITTTSGDGLDFNASGGTSGDPANLTLTPDGAITGAANGIVVTQNGTGDVSVTTSGSVRGFAGNGITVQDSGTGSGNLTVDAVGQVTGTGAGSVGLKVQNLNAANSGNIQVTATGGATGDAFGINIDTAGNGNITLEAAGIIATGNSANSEYGIRVVSSGTGSETITTDDGTSINSHSTGINVSNISSSIPLDANNSIVSSITINAHGTIDSGTAANISGAVAGGIYAGYRGAPAQQAAVPVLGVYGDVTVNNFANISATAGYGINAYNYGNGDVTVNDEAGTTITGAQYGVAAFALSGGTGDVTVAVAAGATITGTSAHAIVAENSGAGNVTVTTSDGDTINSGAGGIAAFNSASSLAAGTTVSVTARGTINSGTSNNPNGTSPGGIEAGYFPGSTQAVDGNVAGNVFIDSYATIIAAAGYGIDGYNWGTGDVTITAESTSSITATGTEVTGNGTTGIGIGAFANDGGNVSVTQLAGAVDTGLTGLVAHTFGTGTITINNAGQIAGTSGDGVVVKQDTNATGSTTITNSGTVTGSVDAVYILENASGTATIDNLKGGTIGSTAAGSAIREAGGHVSIDNHGTIDGTVNVGNGTFTNETDGVWNDGGSNDFGTVSGSGFTIDNLGIINLSNGASLSGTDGLTITDSGTINNHAGSGAINHAAITIAANGILESTGGTLTIDALSSITNTAGGTVAAHGGDLVISGTLSGTAEIFGASMIELGDSASGAYSSATIIFEADSTGTLKIHDAANFSGTISGFGAGTTIDLSGVAFAAGEYTLWTQGSGGGTLTVYNAANVEVASLHLDGTYTSNEFAVKSDGASGGSDISFNTAPAIDTDHFEVTQNDDGSTTISGLSVTDSESTATYFSLSASTGNPQESSIAPNSDTHVSLAQINLDLSSVVYSPGTTPPSQDTVALTVTDNLGHSDTVNFVFNESGSGPGITLQGTPGNDVIFATGQQDTLTGNGGQDQFVFKPSDAGQATTVEHTITDFNVHLDTIDLRQFDISSVASIIASATPGNDTVLTLDDHQTLLLKGVTASSLHASDFIVTPHTV